MFDFLKKFLSTSNEGEVKRLRKILDQVNAFEPSIKNLSDAKLRDKTDEFKGRIANGETLDAILPEAFAVVREAAIRTIGQRPFDVQVIGGIVLHQGRIAEMKTGEGKTITATMPAYLNALSGKGVHIVTVNDYLAKSQGELMSKVHRLLGLSVGLILHDLDNTQRQKSYAADITYGTNNEFGFDYLRDNMVVYKGDMVQRPLNFAIVDEVDSILIDEARTPLIISGQGDKSTDMYTRADKFAQKLKLDEDFAHDEKLKAINLTEDGAAKAERHFSVENLSDIGNTELNHHIIQALKANFQMKRDVDYVVQNGQVVIVDEFTGRLMTGRRYSDGLHQAIEAKEGVKVERESKTLATITFQNYFRMYKKLSGMTGTAKTEEEEFKGIYNLDVVQVPTNMPMIRKDLNDAVYRNVAGKFKAVVEEIITHNKTGQPVLVGTVSVEKSEILAKMLSMRGINHVVLNAKFHQKEAEIVAQAGKRGSVTIATNMAGRGTDILLGGNSDFLARQEMKRLGYEEYMIDEASGHSENAPDDVIAARSVYSELKSGYKKHTDAEHDEIVKLGGLYIIGTERHESRRIDNQLRGRAGRQGDPGSTRFFISLEDELMRLFGSDRIAPIVERLGLEDDQPIEAGILSKQIENAQKRVEGRNYDIRKHVLQYDDVMNQQREIIYGQRRSVLEGQSIYNSIMDMIEKQITSNVEMLIASNATSDEWNLEGLAEVIEKICIRQGGVTKAAETLEIPERKELIEALIAESKAYYAEREAQLTEAGIDMREFERVALLGAVDSRWMDHIDAMDQLRDGIGLRAYGHKDPVVEYKFEGYDMFEEMVRLMQEDTLRKLFMAVLMKRPEREKVAEPVAVNLGGEPATPTQRTSKKVGRNDPCPCGSGKKYKHCCGKEN